MAQNIPLQNERKDEESNALYIRSRLCLLALKFTVHIPDLKTIDGLWSAASERRRTRQQFRGTCEAAACVHVFP
jgi:hypothetical protein